MRHIVVIITNKRRDHMIIHPRSEKKRENKPCRSNVLCCGGRGMRVDFFCYLLFLGTRIVNIMKYLGWWALFNKSSTDWLAYFLDSPLRHERASELRLFLLNGHNGYGYSRRECVRQSVQHVGIVFFLMRGLREKFDGYDTMTHVYI